MKRTLYLTVTFALTTLAVVAQEPREVVVTRDYQPDVSTARKVDFAPRELDTISLQPDFEYKIAPAPLMLNLPLHLAEPERLDVAQRVLHYPFYVRAAGGVLPIRSLLDVYATMGGEDGKPLLGAYLNHDGSYSEQVNDADVRRSALVMHNDVGGWFSQRWGAARLDASLGYWLSHYNPYGQFTPVYIAPENAAEGLLYYGDVSARAAYSVGNQTFKYAFSGGGGYFYDAVGSGAGYADVSGSVDWKLGRGRLSVSLPVSYEGGAASDFRIGVLPKYEFAIKGVTVGIGIMALYDRYEGYENRWYGLPQFGVSGNLTPGFKLYLTVTSELGSGTYRSLVAQNPYLASGTSAPHPFGTNVRIGGLGNFNQSFTYDIYGGFEYWMRYNYFVAHPSGLFTVATIEGETPLFYVGVALKVCPIADLELNFSAEIKGDPIESFDYDNAWYIQKQVTGRIDARAEAKYNYRNRFYANAGVDVVYRRFATADIEAGEVYSGIDFPPTTINLYAELEGRISRTLNIFVRGENLLNRRIELYDHYFLPGISIMAGVKIVF